MVVSFVQPLRFFKRLINYVPEHFSSLNTVTLAWLQMTVKENKAWIINFKSQSNWPFLPCLTAFYLAKEHLFDFFQHFPLCEQPDITPTHLFALIKCKRLPLIKTLSELINSVQRLTDEYLPLINILCPSCIRFHPVTYNGSKTGFKNFL